jgi:Zn-dependent protease with chaperone function
MIGFYLLALGIAGGLLYIPYAQWAYNDRVNIRILLFCVVAAFLILKSILPQRDKFQPPGPKLEASRQPRLFQSLTRLSTDLQQSMPAEVYLVSDMNAWVAERGGTMGFGSKRVMGLGLPLMQVLSTAQFEAVLAHEFGHFHGGDTRLGPWIYKTRSAIGRILQNLATDPEERFNLMRVVQAPFRWYATMFMRITHAISRAQEYAADRLAANTIGSEHLIEGLRAIHRAAAACDHYLNYEFLPMVRNGFRPPLLEGFTFMLSAEPVAKSLDEGLAQELKAGEQNAYDTHPPLALRIAAVQGLPASKVSHDAPAVSLLDDVPNLEAQLIASWFAEGSPAPQLKQVAWADTGSTVLLPIWKELSKKAAKDLKGLTLQDLPRVVKTLDATAAGAAFASALHERGWAIENAPGMFQMVRGESRLNPFLFVNQLAAGDLKPADWNEAITSAGVDPAMPMD